MGVLFRSLPLPPSKPDSDAGNDLPVENRLLILARVVGAGTDAAHPVHPDVRCKLAPDFVAQTQTELDVGHATANASLRIVSAIQIDFRLRLEDQALGEQHLVLDPQARRGTPRRPDVAGGLDFKPVRRQTLHAKRSPVARRAFAEVVAYTQLATPERADMVIPEHFQVAVFELATTALALAAQPQFVTVAAVPGLQFPGLRVGIATVDRLQLIDQQHARRSASVQVQAVRRTGRDAVGIIAAACKIGRAHV